MLVYNRKTKGLLKTLEYRTGTLDFLYGNFLGRIILKTIVANPWFSRIKSRYQKSAKSHKDIEPFVREYNIDTSMYPMDTYKSFNDFFTRKRTYSTNTNEKDLIAIADAKLLACRVSKDLVLDIKYSRYNIADIIGDESLAEEFNNGICLIYRLAVDDYHRYVFLDDGYVEYSKSYKGKLHTIRPISAEFKAFARNSKCVSLLHTHNFGEVVEVEVGALLVGKINNHKIEQFNRFDEKGYFEYGGSTIIQFFKDRTIDIDEDILEYSDRNIETAVTIGERIGKKL